MKSAIAFACVASAHALAGDPSPSPLPVLNVNVQTAPFIGADQVGQLQAGEAAIASAQAAESRIAAGLSHIGASFLADETPALFDADTEKTVLAALHADCGTECVSYYHEMIRATKAKDVAGKLAEIEGNLQKKFLKMYSQHEESMNSLSSFAASKGSSGQRWNPLDTPCFDAKSCQLAEVVASKCALSRVATLSVYQALNLGAHIFGVLTQTLCGCVNVYKSSFCLLGTILPPVCLPIKQVFLGVGGSMSSQAWAAVKATTKTCGMSGDVRLSP